MAEIDDIRNMNDQDLLENLDLSRKELMNLRFRTATMQLTDTNSIREREISERSA